MQIQIQGTHIAGNQSFPFADQNKKAEKKQGDTLTIHAAQMKAKQTQNKLKTNSKQTRSYKIPL